MKDIINRLSDIENTPDRPSKANKKILKEEKTPQPKEITKASSFKEVFENMSTMSNMKPLPVVGQAGSNNQSQGAAFLDIDDNSPSAKAIQSAVSDLAQQNKAQIVVPNNPADAPNNISAQGMQAVNQNQQNQMQQPLREVDGAPKIASVYVSVTDDECEAEYEFDDDGDVELTGVYDSNDRNVIDLLSFSELESVRQQVVDSLENEKDERGDYEYEKSQDKKLDELSPQTMKNYLRKSADDEEFHNSRVATKGQWEKGQLPPKYPESPKATYHARELSKRLKGQDLAYARMNKKVLGRDALKVDEGASKSIGSAVDKREKERQKLIKKAARELNSKTRPTTADELVKKYDLFPKDKAAIEKMAKELTEGKKVDRMVKHITKSEQKAGKSKDKAEDIAWATANKRGMLDNKNKKKTNEGVKDVVKKGVKNLKRGMKGWEKGMHDVETVKQANKSLDSKGKEDILKSSPAKGSPADLQKKLIARDKRKTTNESALGENGVNVVTINKNTGQKTRTGLLDMEGALDILKKAKARGDTGYIVDHETKKPINVNEGIKEKVKGAIRRELQKDMPLVQTRRDYAWMQAADAYQKGNKRKGDQYMAWQERDRKKAGDPTTNPEGTYRTKTSDFNESKKPDFLDLDKDGNKKESMKKAAADKKKQKVKESMNHKINAARLEGKTHGLRGNAYHGKAYDDLEEMRAYHEGYKEGLDECYMSEDAATSMPSMPTMTMEGANEAAELEAIGEQILELAHEAMQIVRGTPEERAAESYWYPHILGAVSKENQYGGGSMITLMDTVNALQYDDDEEYLGELEGEFGEGNAFTGNLAKARAMGADKFDLDGGGELEPVTEFDEMFESWDKQLKDLINESKQEAKKPLNEGLSVSVNKGNGMGSDSVSITATDQDADELLALIKNSGLGLFGEEPVSEPSSAMSVQPQEMEPETEISVVDGADSMLGLMQKLSGMEEVPGDDYEDEYAGEEDSEEMIGADWGFGTGNYSSSEETEEDGEDEDESEDAEEAEDESEEDEEKVDEGSDTCMECGGMMEAGHSCGSKEMVEESDFFGLLNKLNKLAEGDELDSEGHLLSQESFESFKEKVVNSDDPFEIVHDGLKGVYGDEVLEKLQQCEDEVIQDSEGTLHPDDDHEEIVDRIIEKMSEPEEGEDISPYGEEDSTDWPLEDGEELREWANKAGQKGTDHAFTQDTEFMTQTIAGGLNKPKSTGQTTVPVIASQTDRQHDHENESTEDWMRLAGIKK